MASQSKPLNRLAVALLFLPDGRLALQRRTEDAPIAAGKLGLFGGHMEEGETPLQCVLRELQEETSLDVPNLNLQFKKEILLPASVNFDRDRNFYVFEASVPSDNFEVYEGSGVESYQPNELLERDDVSEVVRWALDDAK